MVSEELSLNPLKSRDDLAAALETLIAPLTDCFVKGKTQLNVGSGGHHYTENAAGLEGLSRPLWGIVPYCMHSGRGNRNISSYIRSVQQGVAEGSNPDSMNYWGDVTKDDQKIVEMTVMGLSLAMCPELIFSHLTEQEQSRFANWLYQVNDNDVKPTNWLFFRVIINIGLEKQNLRFSQQNIDKDLETVERFYLSNGWYTDGDVEQVDHYNAFAFHCYGLLYSWLMGQEDPERAKRYKHRAAQFANQFVHWFSPDGNAVPFGRSMTYRFAIGAFWGLCAVSGLDREPECAWLTPGVTKGLLLRHLRSWFKQPIFSKEGMLTVGYCYPNLSFSENYNAPGSPYWALKAFMVLSLPENSAFWESDEESYPSHLPAISEQREPKCVVCRDTLSGEVSLLSAGQVCDFDPRHSEYKYAKFAYSSHTAFSVPTEARKLTSMGGDNSLLISTDGMYWKMRRNSIRHEICHNMLFSDSEYDETTLVRTILIWHLNTQIRIHLVRNSKKVVTVEGGYACPVDGNTEYRDIRTEKSRHISEYLGKGRHSIIYDIPIDTYHHNVSNPGSEALNVVSDTNSNLSFSRSVIPSVRRELEPGVSIFSTACISCPSKLRNFYGNDKAEFIFDIKRNPQIKIGREKITFPLIWLDSFF
ncbi:DUF2264 domain-containing protein [Parasalinivibrio latis]|uniref:DUF2264 domain-containing protein n=1 Tax=Parasalinivibrio latis TaxID=2952610 RepID=UPI0030E1B7A9